MSKNGKVFFLGGASLSFSSISSKFIWALHGVIPEIMKYKAVGTEVYSSFNFCRVLECNFHVL